MDNTTRFRSYPQMATVKKTAEVFGVSASYIRRLCRAGKISFVNTGHVWLVNLDSLARYFEAGDPGPAGLEETAGGIRRVAR
jgi:excisionase family DNA binding protein